MIIIKKTLIKVLKIINKKYTGNEYNFTFFSDMNLRNWSLKKEMDYSLIYNKISEAISEDFLEYVNESLWEINNIPYAFYSFYLHLNEIILFMHMKLNEEAYYNHIKERRRIRHLQGKTKEFKQNQKGIFRTK